MTFASRTSTIQLAAAITAAYVANNPVPVSDLPALIARVHIAVAGLASGGSMFPEGAHGAADIDRPSSVEVLRSIRPDGIVSFIDGKAYKTLKRHLTSHGLDPRSYRERFALPADYPMVAPEYAERRSMLAKAIGLGQPGAMAERDRKDRRAA
ncbi:MucR family transcriptional regulator [Methylobacterium pseudosasicola]|uniref:Transcriptional regulator, MucR family n=1 Tax=Methylobacterium pseudosasicola TaxID=582667 RepID=A0A1I4T7A4_9HYPH|nr:MucR family transcriptional regulator [Methylobacterium pseudosasicola]SFM72440.1 transcriptional regulator, MucR family [Methylobacterium pseudosasicola]